MTKSHSMNLTYYPPPPLSTLLDDHKHNNRSLYHDILKYTIKRGNEPFKFNDLAKWLMENNTDFFNFYTGFNSRISMSARIANKRHRIQGCIDDLVAWGFIQIIGKIKAQKNESETPQYRSMLEGQLLSYFLDMKSSLTDDKTKTIEAILLVIDSIAKELDSSIVFFILDFFRRSHSKKTFVSIISHFLNIVVPESRITNGKEMLVLFLGLKNCVNWILADHESFWNALNGLDAVHRKIVLFQFKTEIED